MAADPIRISIQFDVGTGEATIRRVTGTLEDLQAATSRVSSTLGNASATVKEKGAALRELESQYARTAATMRNTFVVAADAATNSLENVFAAAGKVARMSFFTFVAEILGAVYALERLAKSFIDVNEKFAGLEITLKSSFGSLSIAKELSKEVQDITARSPLPFSDIAETLRAGSVIPYTRGLISQDAALGQTSSPNSAINRLVSLVEQMTTFRPDKTAVDAIFAIREALTGQFRSITKRFDIPISGLTNAAGVGNKELTQDPAKTFAAMEKFFSGIISKQAVQERIERQPSLIKQNIVEQAFDIPAKTIGDAGFFKAFTDSLLNIFKQATDFATNTLPQYAKPISDALSKIWTEIVTAGSTVLGFLLKATGFGANEHPEFSNNFERAYAAISSGLQVAGEKLPGIFDRVIKFFEVLLPAVVKLVEIMGSFVEKWSAAFTSAPILTIIGTVFATEIPALLSRTFLPWLARSLAESITLGFTQGVEKASSASVLARVVKQDPTSGRYSLAPGGLSQLTDPQRSLLGISPLATGSPFLNQAKASAALSALSQEEQQILSLGKPSGRIISDVLERQPSGRLAAIAGSGLTAAERSAIGQSRPGGFLNQAQAERALAAGTAYESTAAGVASSAGRAEAFAAAVSSFGKFALGLGISFAVFQAAVYAFDYAAKVFTANRELQAANIGDTFKASGRPVEDIKSLFQDYSLNLKGVESSRSIENRYRSENSLDQLSDTRITTSFPVLQSQQPIPIKQNFFGRSYTTSAIEGPIPEREVTKTVTESISEFNSNTSKLITAVANLDDIVQSKGHISSAFDPVANKTVSLPSVAETLALGKDPSKVLSDLNDLVANYRKQLEARVNNFYQVLIDSLKDVSPEYRVKLTELLTQEQKNKIVEFTSKSTQFTDGLKVLDTYFSKTLNPVTIAGLGLQGPDSIQGAEEKLRASFDKLDIALRPTHELEKLEDQYEAIESANKRLVELANRVIAKSLTAANPLESYPTLNRLNVKSQDANLTPAESGDSANAPAESSPVSYHFGLSAAGSIENIRSIKNPAEIAQPDLQQDLNKLLAGVNDYISQMEEWMKGQKADVSSLLKKTLDDMKAFRATLTLPANGVPDFLGIAPGGLPIIGPTQAPDTKFVQDKFQGFQSKVDQVEGSFLVDRLSNLFISYQSELLPALSKIETVKEGLSQIVGPSVESTQKILEAAKFTSSQVDEFSSNISRALYKTVKTLGVDKLSSETAIIERQQGTTDVSRTLQEITGAAVVARTQKSLPQIQVDPLKSYSEQVDQIQAAIKGGVTNTDNILADLLSLFIKIRKVTAQSQDQVDALQERHDFQALRLEQQQGIQNALEFFSRSPADTGGKSTSFRGDAAVKGLAVNNLPTPTVSQQLALQGTVNNPQDVTAQIQKYNTAIPLLHEIGAAMLKDSYDAKEQSDANKLLKESLQFEDLARSYEQAVKQIKGAGLWESFKEGMQDMLTQWKETAANFTEIGKGMLTSFTTDFSSSFTAFVTGTQTLSQAWASFAKAFLTNLTNMLMQKAITGLIGVGVGAIGGLSSAASGATTANVNAVGTAPTGTFIDTTASNLPASQGFSNPFAKGGQVNEYAMGGPVSSSTTNVDNSHTTTHSTAFNYASGGKVSNMWENVQKCADGGSIFGGSGSKDDVPILAMGGEYMLNKSSVNYYGLARIEAINNKTLPREALKHPAAPAMAAGGSPSLVNVSDGMISNCYAAGGDIYNDSMSMAKGGDMHKSSMHQARSENASNQYFNVKVRGGDSQNANDSASTSKAWHYAIGGPVIRRVQYFAEGGMTAAPVEGDTIFNSLPTIINSSASTQMQEHNAGSALALNSYAVGGTMKSAINSTQSSSSNKELNQQNSADHSTLVRYASGGMMSASTMTANSAQMAVDESSSLSNFYRYDGGGRITQGSGMKDDVPIMSEKGAYVLNKSSVEFYGLDSIRRVNDQALPRFASGGYVPVDPHRVVEPDVTQVAKGGYIEVPYSVSTVIPAKTYSMGGEATPVTPPPMPDITQMVKGGSIEMLPAVKMVHTYSMGGATVSAAAPAMPDFSLMRMADGGSIDISLLSGSTAPMARYAGGGYPADPAPVSNIVPLKSVPQTSPNSSISVSVGPFTIQNNQVPSQAGTADSTTKSQNTAEFSRIIKAAVMQTIQEEQRIGGSLSGLKR